MEIERLFKNIRESDVRDADQQDYLTKLGWLGAIGWEELLRSKRVLIISEAGAGKTHECRARREILWNAGEPAFFLELRDLAAAGLRAMLTQQEEERLDAWSRSQSAIATFFLDSIDELKISRGSFEQALQKLKKGISDQLARARIVITTRPVPFDKELIDRLLPVPETDKIEYNGDTFARIARHGRADSQPANAKDAPPDKRLVALMPLSDDQIEIFAQKHGVPDSKALLADLKRRRAEEFARRPQDLIELCSIWRDVKNIRTHRDQVVSNIRTKLKPAFDREEALELSAEKATEGAERLALALTLTRRSTIRHNALVDRDTETVALDPELILEDWSAAELKTLLERSLFGFASYGRVRFHHRSVVEFLAAERLFKLRMSGRMQIAALKRLIFAETRGKTIVWPSKRAIAGWLALKEPAVFEALRDHEPAVLLDEGDPASLTLAQRAQALRSYVEKYGSGGWRGLNAPYIQVHRFASPELGDEIVRQWKRQIENDEVRNTLLRLMAEGRTASCADIAHALAIDGNAFDSERLLALDVLAAIDDCRLDGITAGIAKNAGPWPDNLVRRAALRLFPSHLHVDRLCAILARVKDSSNVVDSLGWGLCSQSLKTR